MQVDVVFKKPSRGIGYFFVAQGFWDAENLAADEAAKHQ